MIEMINILQHRLIGGNPIPHWGHTVFLSAIHLETLRLACGLRSMLSSPGQQLPGTGITTHGTSFCLKQRLISAYHLFDRSNFEGGTKRCDWKPRR